MTKEKITIHVEKYSFNGMTVYEGYASHWVEKALIATHHTGIKRMFVLDAHNDAVYLKKQWLIGSLCI